MGLFDWLKSEFGKPTNSPPKTRTATPVRPRTSAKRAATKQELLALVTRGLEDVEKAIGHHPPEIRALYEQGKRVLVKGQLEGEGIQWLRNVGLSLQELGVVNQYLLATAFMSGWYCIHKDQERWNQAATPACMLVSAFGITPEEVIKRHMQFELAWVTLMRAGGMGE